MSLPERTEDPDVALTAATSIKAAFPQAAAAGSLVVASPTTASGPLDRLEQATRLLAETRSMDEVLQIRDMAEAARAYARAARLGLEAQNDAAEIKLRAERRAGELIESMERNRGTVVHGPIIEPPDETPRLGDLGISRSQASRWRAAAIVPELRFEQHVREAKAEGRELTSASVLSIARPLMRERRRPAVVEPARDGERATARVQVLVGDARRGLGGLGKQRFQTVVSSPPYFGFRAFGTAPQQWADGWVGELGQEPHPDMYVAHLVETLRGVREVLRDDGSVWLNVGDGSAGSGMGPSGWNGSGNQAKRQGFTNASKRRPADIPAKSLYLVPERLGLALLADDWVVRRRIPWVAQNRQGESVEDRVTGAVEYVYLLNKTSRVYWDPEAVRQPSVDGQGRQLRTSDFFYRSLQGLLLDAEGEPLALNVPVVPGDGLHYAGFPPGLVEPMLLASSRPGDQVLDMFAGLGTVGAKAAELGRDCTLIELNPGYAREAAQRIRRETAAAVDVVDLSTGERV